MYLGKVLKPAAEAKEDNEHGYGVKKCGRAAIRSSGHKVEKNDNAVQVGHIGRQHHQYVHVCHAVPQGPKCWQIEVSPTQKLEVNSTHVISISLCEWNLEEHTKFDVSTRLLKKLMLNKAARLTGTTEHKQSYTWFLPRLFLS